MKFFLRKMRAAYVALLVLFGITLPTVIYAQTTSGVQGGLTQIKPLFPSQSELTQSEDVGQVILAVIRILFILLFAVSVLFILIGGFQYVTSAGREEQAKKGHKTLTYAVIGLVVSILAFTIVYAVSNSLAGPEV